MSLGQNVKSLYVNSLRPEEVRQIVLPAGAAVTLTANAAGSTYGAWAAVALAATVLVDTLVTGVVVSAPSVTDVFTVDVGSCAGYANVAAVNAVPAAIIAAHRAEVRADYGVVVTTAVGTHGWVGGFIPLTFPVWIPAGVEIIGRCYGVTAVAVTIDMSVVCVQNF